MIQRIMIYMPDMRNKKTRISPGFQGLLNIGFLEYDT